MDRNSRGNMRKKILLDKTKEWVIDVHKKIGNKDRPRHLLRTAEWIKILKHRVSEEEVIAALTHDMERAFPPKRGSMSDSGNLVNPDYLRWHSKRSATITGKFLKKIGAGNKITSDIKKLISSHEFGGNHSSNMLKDADSLANLEVYGPKFVEWTPNKYSWEETEKKFQWMFDRISSSKAKIIAKKYLKDNLKKLNLKRRKNDR